MFVYKNWERFCQTLAQNKIYSVTATNELETKRNSFLILKHDVETSPRKALKLAEIEARQGHKGTYYVQFYLLEKPKNIKILKKIQELGHEVTYHHDVMDRNAGDIVKAIDNFDANVKRFEDNGFSIKTVCQHGNPIVKREGYFSNRDFFRNEQVRARFPHISEIMVDYKRTINVNYTYISDAGYKWKIIYDPENNDRINSEDKNIPIESFEDLLAQIKKQQAVIISTHPHRWQKNVLLALIKNAFFKRIKQAAKLFLKIPIAKKLMEKFYFLAKKI